MRKNEIQNSRPQNRSNKKQDLKKKQSPIIMPKDRDKKQVLTKIRFINKIQWSRSKKHTHTKNICEQQDPTLRYKDWGPKINIPKNIQQQDPKNKIQKCDPNIEIQNRHILKKQIQQKTYLNKTRSKDRDPKLRSK